MTAPLAEQQLRCPDCNRVLGMVEFDGLVTVRHHGRTIEAERVVSIACEDCRGVWRPSATVERPRRGARIRLG